MVWLRGFAIAAVSLVASSASAQLTVRVVDVGPALWTITQVPGPGSRSHYSTTPTTGWAIAVSTAPDR